MIDEEECVKGEIYGIFEKLKEFRSGLQKEFKVKE